LLDVAVNISAKDVEDLDLPERLQQHCLDAAIDPSLIVLEITETSAMREAVEILDVLTRVRLKGFKLSIDDLGVGYSSLIKLQRLPFSEIKIDRFFVMNMVKNHSCLIIVEMLLEMARRLGLHTVGEGVEDEATLEALFERGCGMAQGYYLARPMAAAETSSFIRQRNSSGARLMATGG
jgi:EAL domain-containing protein (putative c-di-GMP-specific phosphodiesterase class I)